MEAEETLKEPQTEAVLFIFLKAVMTVKARAVWLVLYINLACSPVSFAVCHPQLGLQIA